MSSEASTAAETLRRTPLFDVHIDAGATMAPFAGWDMPLSYPAGTVSEHRAVRASAGVFDVSHMGQVRLRGPAVEADLRRLFAGRFDRIVEPGHALYALLVTEHGGIHDDVIIYRVADDEMLVVCNAGNRSLVVGLLVDGVSSNTEVEDISDQWAMLALQGPAALDVLATLGVDQRDASPFTFVTTTLLGHTSIIAMTGYTGERGCELLVPADAAHDLWSALVLDDRVEPCGLGARDTLRLEACFPLHGSDIDMHHDAVSSSLGWVIDWDEPACIAHDALSAVRAAGPAEKLVPLLVTGRGVPRPGCVVHAVDLDAPVGIVTSGTFGPSVGSGIALARVATGRSGDEHADLTAIGTQLQVDIRGRKVAAEVVQRPFVRGTPGA